MLKDIEKWRKAGKIAAEARDYGKVLIKNGGSILEVANKIEGKIRSLGGEPAFPVQMSSNDVAAHFYPNHDDKAVFNGELVCLDVGVHVDGCIGDTAVSVDLSGKNSELVKASEKALSEALRIVKPGAMLTEIGKVIGDCIESFGFKPIRNLSGHGLAPYEIHTIPTIPNFDSKDEERLVDGQTIAIEPFATTGVGLIHEKGDANLFILTGIKSVRIGFVRNIQNEILKLNGLPFAKNWLLSKFSEAQVNYALKQFKQLGNLHEFPPLVEKSNGLVSQAEHTVIVGKRSEVTTRID